jgi:hypothetical protein
MVQHRRFTAVRQSQVLRENTTKRAEIGKLMLGWPEMGNDLFAAVR